MKSVLCVLGVFFAGVVAATELVIDASDGDVTFSTRADYVAATKIVKTGTGKATLDFGAAKPSSFVGEIEVREGTLAAGSPLDFGQPSRITVVDGATLDLSSARKDDTNAGSIPSAEIVIAGTGVDNGGALRRMTGGTVNGLLGTVTLAADALITIRKQVGFAGTATKPGILNLEGHTLSLDASETAFYCPYTHFRKDGSTDDPGHVFVRSGTFFPRYDSMEGGSARNTLTLASGARLRLREVNTHIGWTLVTQANATIECERANNAPGVKNVWAGPVQLGGQLTLNMSNPTTAHVTIAGDIQGTRVLAKTGIGSAKITGSNEVERLVVRNKNLLIGGGTTVVGKRDVAAPPFDLSRDRASSQEAGIIQISNAVCAVRNPNGKENTVRGSVVEGIFSAIPRIVVDQGGVLTANPRIDNGSSMSRIYIGKVAPYFGIVDVRAGAVVTNFSFGIGRGGHGTLWQRGGCLHWLLSGDNDNAGYAAGSSGFVNLDGGRLLLDGARSKATFGVDGDCAMVCKGGVLEASTDGTVSFATGSGSFRYYQSSGRTNVFAGSLSMGLSASRANPGMAELTLMGAGTCLRLEDALRVYVTNAAARMTFTVRDGAAFAAARCYRAVGKTVARLLFNVDGGILCPTLRDGSTTGSFFEGGANARAMPDAVTIFEGGCTIDTSFARTPSGETGSVDVYAPLRRPPDGLRVRSIALPTDVAFTNEVYIGSPRVVVTGAGEGATAMARFDPVARKVTAIDVTSPGWGYDEETTRVTVESSSRTNSYVCAVTLAEPPTDGWQGLAKRGAAPLTLWTANTYRGDTRVEEGRLEFKAAGLQGGLPAGSGLYVGAEGEAMFPGNNFLEVPSLGGGGRIFAASGTLSLFVTGRVDCTCAELFQGRGGLRVGGSVALAEDLRFHVTDPENLEVYANAPSALVLTAERGLQRLGRVALETSAGEADPRLVGWELKFSPTGIRFGYSKSTLVIVR